MTGATGETKTVTDEDVTLDLSFMEDSKLVLYNDDHNSFDHVIKCLVIYCQHNLLQAEQCALIVHTKGKCDIKHGTFDELLPINEILGKNDLTTEIQL
jgi:ATP-dependent Clp protease adaptor protein ClpS